MIGDAGQGGGCNLQPNSRSGGTEIRSCRGQRFWDTDSFTTAGGEGQRCAALRVPKLRCRRGREFFQRWGQFLTTKPYSETYWGRNDWIAIVQETDKTFTTELNAVLTNSEWQSIFSTLNYDTNSSRSRHRSLEFSWETDPTEAEKLYQIHLSTHISSGLYLAPSKGTNFLGTTQN